MALFDFLKKKQTRKRVNVEIRSYVNGKEVPLSEEEEPDGIKPQAYYQMLQAEVKPLENMMVNLAVSLKGKKEIDDRIATLTSLIDTFYALKIKCFQLGSEYAEHFKKNWEHCHNSRNPDFSYVDRFEKELAELRANYDSIKAKEAAYATESVNLKHRVIDVVKSSPGILQKDIYKEFDPTVKADIQEILYFLDKQGRIHRVKVGNSYSVTLSGK